MENKKLEALYKHFQENPTHVISACFDWYYEKYVPKYYKLVKEDNKYFLDAIDGIYKVEIFDCSYSYVSEDDNNISGDMYNVYVKFLLFDKELQEDTYEWANIFEIIPENEREIFSKDCYFDDFYVKKTKYIEVEVIGKKSKLFKDNRLTREDVFLIRDNNMVVNIKKYLDQDYKLFFIVVGDTHLREKISLCYFGRYYF